MPSPREVANFQSIVANLAAVAVARVGALVAGTQDSSVLQDAYPQLIDPFIGASGQLAAEWYQSLDPESTFAVEVDEHPALPVLQTNVRWALTQPDLASALSGSAERQVFTSTRNTLVRNASREHVRYARYASATACSWCRVLATRDPVYHSAENAVKGHDNCHCIAVPVRGGDTYTPPDYVHQWLDEYNAARDEVGGNLNDIVNHMRRMAI